MVPRRNPESQRASHSRVHRSTSNLPSLRRSASERPPGRSAASSTSTRARPRSRSFQRPPVRFEYSTRVLCPQGLRKQNWHSSPGVGQKLLSLRRSASERPPARSAATSTSSRARPPPLSFQRPPVRFVYSTRVLCPQGLREQNWHSSPRVGAVPSHAAEGLAQGRSRIPAYPRPQQRGSRFERPDLNLNPNRNLNLVPTQRTRPQPSSVALFPPPGPAAAGPKHLSATPRPCPAPTGAGH